MCFLLYIKCKKNPKKFFPPSLSHLRECIFLIYQISAHDFTISYLTFQAINLNSTNNESTEAGGAVGAHSFLRINHTAEINAALRSQVWRNAYGVIDDIQSTEISRLGCIKYFVLS